jgi:hypothetical protein
MQTCNITYVQDAYYLEHHLSSNIFQAQHQRSHIKTKWKWSFLYMYKTPYVQTWNKTCLLN